jgi:hypothetical protein
MPTDTQLERKQNMTTKTVRELQVGDTIIQSGTEKTITSIVKADNIWWIWSEDKKSVNVRSCDYLTTFKVVVK